MKTIEKLQVIRPVLLKRKRVAAYASVSMETDRLKHSLSSQISYYNQYIQKNSEWEYIGVYADSGISGTSAIKRPQFQKLIKDCKSGKIDIILTKSIQRFARNTVDLLNTVRELKEIGVEVIFEKENINSMSGDGELMLSILASVAQEESNTISQNVRWMMKQKFQKGLPHVPQAMLGYRWHQDHYEVVEAEAKMIQRVYQLYLKHIQPAQIVKILNDARLTTRKGNSFTRKIIHNILNQEAYTGKLILQKTYRTPFKNRAIPNQGEMPMYIVEDTHEAIITQSDYDLVQQLKVTQRKRKE